MFAYLLALMHTAWLPAVLPMPLYIGPGVGVGSVIAIVGILVVLLFVLYSFVILPLRKYFRKRKDG